MINLLNKNSGKGYFGASPKKKSTNELHYIKGILQEIRLKEKRKLKSGIDYHTKRIIKCEFFINNINEELKKRRKLAKI